MKIGRVLLVCALAFGFSRPDALREGSGIVCALGMSERVSLRSTERLPEANGEARVERMGGTTKIDVDIDSMKPASLFGGDYNTYVLWVVPPGGWAENLGEFVLDGDHSKRRASTDATTFAILVTAEPHYLVTTPSAFVVLENKSTPNAIEIRYPVVQGVYNFERTTLSDVKEAKGEVHSEVRQAFTAVRLARRAGANDLAPGEFLQANRALDRTFSLWRGRADWTEIAAQARETIRLAVASQRLATDRAFQRTQPEVEGGGGKGESKGVIREVTLCCRFLRHSSQATRNALY